MNHSNQDPTGQLPNPVPPEQLSQEELLAYVHGLEARVNTLEADNTTLREENLELSELVAGYEQEGIAEENAGLLDQNTELGRLIFRLEERYHLDHLTGIQNRQGLEANYKHLALSHKKPRGVEKFMQLDPNPSFMLFIDLDDFKALNDTLGHDAGDQALITVSEILTRTVRWNDVVGRISGDEFMVILDHLPPHKIEDIAEKIRKAIEDIPQPVTASVGITKINFDFDYKTIKSAADDAMYKAKQEGKNQVVILGEEESAKPSH